MAVGLHGIDNVDPDQSAGAGRVAVDAIREMIVAGDLLPGNKVPPERELAQMFGLSRSSVREAVRELSALGILSARRGDGTYVSSLDSEHLFAPLEFALRVDPKLFLHMADLRLILEPHIANVATARITPQGIETLSRAVAMYGEEVESPSPDVARLLEIDKQIHQTLVHFAGNPLLAAMVRSIDATVRCGREVIVVERTGSAESLNELRALVDAVIARDPARAQAAMTWHVTRWAERIRTELTTDPAG
jgi:GntR family transcriptional repressor for pyruvate dehydrogenase complex